MATHRTPKNKLEEGTAEEHLQLAPIASPESENDTDRTDSPPPTFPTIAACVASSAPEQAPSKQQVKKKRGVYIHINPFMSTTPRSTIRTIRSFLAGISFGVILLMGVGAFATWFCIHFSITSDINFSIVTFPVIFPISFAINACYVRREKALDELASLRTCLAETVQLFYHIGRDPASKLPQSLGDDARNVASDILQAIPDFLSKADSKERTRYLCTVYHHLDRLNDLVEKVRLKTDYPQYSTWALRLINDLQCVSTSFEKLRVIREYRTPLSLSGFTTVTVWLLPLIVAPYCAYLCDKYDTWAGYYTTLMISGIFGVVSNVRSQLEDPFDGIGEDDVNMTGVRQWIHDRFQSSAGGVSE